MSARGVLPDLGEVAQRGDQLRNTITKAWVTTKSEEDGHQGSTDSLTPRRFISVSRHTPGDLDDQFVVKRCWPGSKLNSASAPLAMER